MSGGIQIGDVLELAILNKPFDYKIAFVKAPPQPSENWERDALATFLWLMKYGKTKGLPVDYDSLDEIAAWYPKQDFCGSEDFARIYGGRNVASAVAAREAFKLLGHEAGYRFFVDWTRAMAGYVALGTGWGPGKNISYDKLVASLRPNKPQLVLSEPNLGTNPDIKGADCFVLPGDRSFAHNGIGWLAGSGLCGLPHLVKGDLKTFLACRTTHAAFDALYSVGASILLCDPEESKVAVSAMNNDIGAIREIWDHWLPKAPLPRDEFMVVRRTTGVEGVRLRGTEAPTAQLDYCSWRAIDQQQRFMAVNDAYRQAYIRSSAVKHDENMTKWTAYTDNPDEGDYREISCEALSGDIVFAARFGGGVRAAIIPDFGSSASPEVPAPPVVVPPKKKVSWIERMGL